MLTKESKCKSIQRAIPKLNSLALHRIYKYIHANDEVMTVTKRNYLVNLSMCSEETVDAIYDLVFCADF